MEIGTGEANSEAANSMMQRFLDSALQYAHIDEVEETRSEDHFKNLPEGFESARPSSSLHRSHTFSFKFEDRRGMMHRFICGLETTLTARIYPGFCMKMETMIRFCSLQIVIFLQLSNMPDQLTGRG